MSALLALAAALVYGVADFSGGVASRRAPVLVVLAWTQVVGLAGILVAAPLVGAGHVRFADLAWGGFGGFIGLIGVGLLYRAFALGSMTVVAPLAAVLSALVPLGVGIALGERPGALAALGVAAAIPAILLSSGARRPRAAAAHPRVATAMALLAGIGFGFYFVALGETSDASGLWPLVAGRAVTSLVALGVVAARPSRSSIAGARGVAVAAALLEVLANALFLLAVRAGALSLASVITALYPASTVLLALVLLKERVDRLQVAGLALAAVAVALIAA